MVARVGGRDCGAGVSVLQGDRALEAEGAAGGTGRRTGLVPLTCTRDNGSEVDFLFSVFYRNKKDIKKSFEFLLHSP